MITDAELFDPELVRELLAEDERGDTPLMRCIDTAILGAIENGADGVAL